MPMGKKLNPTLNKDMNKIVDKEDNEIKVPTLGATYSPDDDDMKSSVVCKKFYVYENENDFIEVWFGESDETLYRFNGKTKWLEN